MSLKVVILAKAGIQKSLKTMDSRLHGNDENPVENSFSTACSFFIHRIQKGAGALSEHSDWSNKGVRDGNR
jgi:hypothetical protein